MRRQTSWQDACGSRVQTCRRPRRPGDSFHGVILGLCKRVSGDMLLINIFQTRCCIVLDTSFCWSQALTQTDRQKFAAASLGALYQLLSQSAQTLRGDVAFPELFGPLQRVARKVPGVLPLTPPATGSRVFSGYATMLVEEKLLVARFTHIFWPCCDAVCDNI